MIVKAWRIELYLPSVASLKEKRGIIKSLLVRGRQKFPVSLAEVGANDQWNGAVIGLALVTNRTVQSEQIKQSFIDWVENNFPVEIIGIECEVG